MSDKKSEEKQDNAIADAVKQALEQALPLIAAVTAKTIADSQPRAPEVPFLKSNPSRCHDCGQYKKACKGEHVMMNVWPQDDANAEWFQFVKLNGVPYASNGPGHLICVPKKNNIGHLLAVWEENEKIQRNGRKRSHNSGAIGGTNNFRPFDGSGFGER